MHLYTKVRYFHFCKLIKGGSLGSAYEYFCWTETTNTRCLILFIFFPFKYFTSKKQFSTFIHLFLCNWFLDNAFLKCLYLYVHHHKNIVFIRLDTNASKMCLCLILLVCLQIKCVYTKQRCYSIFRWRFNQVGISWRCMVRFHC